MATDAPTPPPSTQAPINPLTGMPVKPSGAPPGASWGQRMRARLPSRNWSIFLSLLFGGIAAVRYDAYKIKKIRADLHERLKDVREQPVKPGERIGKLLVLVGVPVNHEDAGRVRTTFKDHVKPSELIVGRL